MKSFVRFVLPALFLLGGASAQNLPAIDVFGGYSYLNFDEPASVDTNAQRLGLNGGAGSVLLGLFHHLGAEADFSGHRLNDCAGTTLDCSNFSYLFGPRYTFGNRSRKFTFFVHGLVGQDRFTFPDVSGVSLTDTSFAAGGGGGADYWLSRHIGIQFGPFDYIYTRHLQDDGVPTQGSFQADGGIVFRFGGNLPPSEPKEAKAEPECKTHRSLVRPWHKKTECAPAETQPTVATSSSKKSTAPARQPAQPAQPAQPTAGHGMGISALGLSVAPQEFDGAKIIGIVPGSIAEMASLHVGDLIKSVDGKPVRTPMELAAELLDKTGPKVRIGIQRGDFATETTILLGTH